MKIIKAILVDDESANLEVLQILLNKFCPEILVECVATNVDEAFIKIKNNEIQLVFLDVMMPEKTGFDLLRMFDKIHFEIIFVSAFDEYALRAFEFAAIDYILKPIDFDKLKSAVKRCIERIELKTTNHLIQFVASLNEKEQVISKIPIYAVDKVRFIEIEDISYIVGESGGYSTVYLKNGEQDLLVKSLTSIENLLSSDARFIRANKTTILNIKDIFSYERGVSNFLHMKTNNFEIEVSRRKKREITGLLTLK